MYVTIIVVDRKQRITVVAVVVMKTISLIMKLIIANVTTKAISTIVITIVFIIIVMIKSVGFIAT